MSQPIKITQALEKAAADYQRFFGRPATIEKLDHMADARREAERVIKAERETAKRAAE